MIKAYEDRKRELVQLRGFNNVTEMQLYHGTHEAIIEKIFERGFIPPADYEASEKCPTSKHLYNAQTNKAGTSLCLVDCTHCKKAHAWSNCHMYGLGIYFASNSAKSDRYVKDMNSKPDSKTGRKMLLCKVMLGKSQSVGTFLSKEDEMHDVTLPNSSIDSFYVKGVGNAKIPKGALGSGLGVMNDEYIIFHPFQALPEYLIEFDM